MNTLIDEIIQIKNELIQSKEKFEKLISKLVDDESEDESDDEELQSRLHTIREGYKVPEAQYESEDESDDEDLQSRLRKILESCEDMSDSEDDIQALRQARLLAKAELYDVDSESDD
jgi:hypothetical protein